MNRQALDLDKSAAILWRHRLLVAVLVVLGLVGNTAYAMAQPEVYTSRALVMLSPFAGTTGDSPAAAATQLANYFSTQVVVVTSGPVLSDVVRTAKLGLSVQTLRERVNVTLAAALTLSISAQGDTAQEAETTANAVTPSYLAYVTASSNPEGQQAAESLQPAATAIAKPRSTRAYQAAGVGGLAGVLVALVAVLAIWGNDRRLRRAMRSPTRSQYPSWPLSAPDARGRPQGGARLLEQYEPGAADAWQLQRVLRELNLSGESLGSSGGSVAVLSLSADKDALALGPQLAAFAAAQGIPTDLVVGPLRGKKAATALHAACGVAAGQSTQNLRVMVRNHGDVVPASAQAITVAVDVVDARAPHVADTARADATVLAVTAGAATAEQLARVVASAAGAGRAIAGVLVANPDPRDETTGRLPRLARSQYRRMPTRTAG